MQCVELGHRYLLDQYDAPDDTQAQILQFMMRVGKNYPFNNSAHPGTNCQEVIRALIHRIHYLQLQIPCQENHQIVNLLRECLLLFERRAAIRHGLLPPIDHREDIENEPTCPTCGHINFVCNCTPPENTQ